MRKHRPHGPALPEALRVAGFPGGSPYAWISGEANAVKHVRHRLVCDRGFDKGTISVMGCWRRGVGEEAVRWVAVAP